MTVRIWIGNDDTQVPDLETSVLLPPLKAGEFYIIREDEDNERVSDLR